MVDFLQQYWSEIQRSWWPQFKSPARRRKLSPRLEPLEVRTLLAGEFTDLGALGLTGVFKSDVAWGDMDNDNDLDALVIGQDALLSFAKRSDTVTG